MDSPHQRIGAAMGVDTGEIELHPTFDVAPISSAVFQESARPDLDELQPGLVTLDPLYTYHGTATRACRPPSEGALLNQLSTPCMDAGASLLVVNHMNQTGRGCASSGSLWPAAANGPTPGYSAGSP